MRQSADLPESQPRFHLRIEERPTVTLLHVEGDVDLTGAPEFQRHLEKVVERGAPVIVNLSETRYMDSSGISLLDVASRICRQSGLRLVIVLSSRLRRVARLCELDAGAILMDSLREALGTLGAPVE
jgi:anti-sigma B factor antagonist